VSNVDDEEADSSSQPDGGGEAGPASVERTEGKQVGERAPAVTAVGELPPAGEERSGEHGPATESNAAGEQGRTPSVEDKAVEDKAVEDKAVEDKAVEDKAVEDKAVEDKAVEDKEKAGHGTKQVARGGGGNGRQAVRRYWPFAVLGLCTLALGVGVYFAINGAKEPPPPKPSPPAEAAPQKTPPDQLEKFSDPVGGFTLSYPKSWRSVPVPPEGSDLRLVLSTGTPDPAAPASPNPTGNDGMWVRVIPAAQVEQKYTDFAAEIKALTGDKPCGTEGSPCLRQEQASVAGMNGVRFIYVTPDESGQNSIHVEYFLRRNPQANLYVIVLQAVPTTDLSGLAPTFDEILASFQAA